METKIQNLKKTIESIWVNEISNGYKEGKYCSERHLQAEFFKHFKSQKELVDYQIWVEPSLWIEPSVHKLLYKKPDIIITNSLERKVVGIIELKYKPQGEALFQFDVQKMKDFSDLNSDHKLYLYTDPFTGEYQKENHFTISSDILCVFAAITQDWSWAVIPDNWKKIQGWEYPNNFLHLGGLISSKDDRQKISFIPLLHQ